MASLSIAYSSLQMSLFADAVIKYIQNGACRHKFVLCFIEHQRRKLSEDVHAVSGITGRAVHLNARILKGFVSVGCIAGLICSHLLYIQQLDERACISRYH